MSESMPYDLTQLFVQALLRKREWDPMQVSQEARALIEHEAGKFGWSRASGEQWMTLLRNAGDLYALIWTQGPLAMISPDVSAEMRAFLNQHAALTLEVADWDADVYRIDPREIRAHGLQEFWPLDPDGPEGTLQEAFCILDLYNVTDN